MDISDAVQPWQCVVVRLGKISVKMFGKKKGNDPGEWTKTGSFVHKPSRGWLHSEDSLSDGGVSYAVKVSFSSLLFPLKR